MSLFHNLLCICTIYTLCFALVYSGALRKFLLHQVVDQKSTLAPEASTEDDPPESTKVYFSTITLPLYNTYYFHCSRIFFKILTKLGLLDFAPHIMLFTLIYDRALFSIH